MLLLIVAFRTHPGCCISSFFVCVALSLTIFSFCPYLTGYFPDVSCIFQSDINRISSTLYTAVLYLRQPGPLSFISNHPMSTTKLVLLIGSLTVIRACGFSTLNRSFNPSTSSTYAVSLRTRELIVHAISCSVFLYIYQRSSINEVYFRSPLVSHVNRIS